MIIYKVTNLINGKVYIGQTIRTLEHRIKQHMWRRETIVGVALNKYGVENFAIEQIDTASSKEELDAKEKYWIKHYDCLSPKGYNLTIGGEGCIGYKMTPEQRKRMSDKKRKFFANGGVSHMKGKRHTAETRAKISANRKGITPNRSYETSNETRAKISASKKGQGVVEVINLDTGERFESITEACEHYGLTVSAVGRVCRGQYKTSGGYRWAYAG